VGSPAFAGFGTVTVNEPFPLRIACVSSRIGCSIPSPPQQYTLLLFMIEFSVTMSSEPFGPFPPMRSAAKALKEFERVSK